METPDTVNEKTDVTETVQAASSAVHDAAGDIETQVS